MKINRDENGRAVSISVTESEVRRMSEVNLIKFVNENIFLIPRNILDICSERLDDICSKCDKSMNRFVNKNINTLPILMAELNDEDSIMNMKVSNDNISNLTLSLLYAIRKYNKQRNVEHGTEEPILVYKLQKAVEELCADKIIDIM